MLTLEKRKKVPNQWSKFKCLETGNKRANYKQKEENKEWKSMKETRNATEKLNNTKSWFFENIDKIDKLLEKIKMSNIRN